MEIQFCVRCGCGLKAPQGINATGDRSIAIFVSAITVGFRPRLKSRAERRVFCIPCMASIALGPQPEGSFNLAVYDMLRDLARQDERVIHAAWEHMMDPRAPLHRMPGSKPDKTLEAPVIQQALQIAG